MVAFRDEVGTRTGTISENLASIRDGFDLSGLMAPKNFYLALLPERC